MVRHTTDWFKPSQGLRQGDLLSPYLFTLCMDVLIKKLTLEIAIPKSSVGFKIFNRGSTIPCLMFADDSLVFCKATPSACNKLKIILDDFCTMSGQLINLTTTNQP